jgi:hypothetical protein
LRSVTHRRALALCLAALIAGCGESSRHREQERLAREAELRQAIEASRAEEREKDRRMYEAAAAEASEHVQAAAASFEEERARLAAQSAPERAEAEAAAALARYTERLRQASAAPASLQVRNAELAPKKNGMCAEFSARDKAGAYAAFKRVVVTDTAVNPEEPPNRDTLALFLAFQVAARDTGCFPDVAKVHVIR